MPSGINALLQELIASPKFELKDSYTDSTAIYVPDGAQLEGRTIRHKDEVHSLDLSPYYFRERFMETPQEKIILKLYLEIDAWLMDEFDKLKLKYV